jgi:hypothetical protein
MSEESTPVLSGAIPSFEIFMTVWEKLSNEHKDLALLVQPGLDLACKYCGQMDQISSYIVAMHM